jgi:DNA-binding winged helix-turn-helix (wHTH) protein
MRSGGRAFDILTVLVERAGQVVGKEELIARVWPSTFVDEANLKIQVCALRRALGDGQGDHRYIVTVVGRGYNFVAPIRQGDPSRASLSPAIAPAAPHNLPFGTSPMIGREEPVTTPVAQLLRRHPVTVPGPGGVGKTTMTLAVTQWMIGAYEHGVWLVDLADLHDPDLLPGAAATMLGLEIRTDNRLRTLVAALTDNRMLLVLDNSKHVTDAVAGLTATVLSGTLGIATSANSREQFAGQGECAEPPRGAQQSGAVARPNGGGSGGLVTNGLRKHFGGRRRDTPGGAPG